jgi:hypothetical protein
VNQIWKGEGKRASAGLQRKSVTKNWPAKKKDPQQGPSRRKDVLFYEQLSDFVAITGVDGVSSRNASI